MADKKISQLTTLAQADVAVTADFLPIVDTSATETKKATPQALVQAGATGATLPVALGAVGTPSYTFTGDLNTGLWSPAADAVAVSTGGVETLRVNSSQNVGIGTASPGYKLTVQSAIDTYAFNIRDTIGNERILIGSRSTAPVDNITPVQMGNDNSGNLFLSSRTNLASGINFYTNAGTAAALRATLDSSGNLGIGTASPVSGGLTIGNDGNSSATPKLAFSTGLTERASLQMGGGSGEMRMTAGYAGYGGFATFYTNGTERMRLDSSGNLGIGTASPGVRVHAYSGTTMGQMTVDGVGAIRSGINFANGGTTYGQVFFDNTPPYDMSVMQQFSTGSLRFGTNNTERMRIDTNGNIVAGASAALATTATNGFLYVPTCAGTPTGTPTAITGMAPIVVDTTNNKLYFYSGGAWRDAGP